MNKSQPYQTDSEVYNQIMSLLRSSLWGEERFPYQAPKDIDWKMIHKELKNHGLQFFPIHILARENPSQSIQYLKADAKNMMRWDKIMQEQQKVCQNLRDEGIPCAVIKGASVAVQYPKPISRPLGDVDVLVAQENFERACLLISDGAEYIGENFRHKEYKRNDVVIEIHREFSTIREQEVREKFDKRIFGAIRDAEVITAGEYDFFRLPWIEHGLTLLEHIDIHLENGLGLRQIVDWMMFVNQKLTDKAWQEEFAPFLRQINREKLAITVTRMCQMYLGLGDNITWCMDADEDLCRRLLEYILNQGNFGRKRPRGSNRAAVIVAATGNVASFFKILQRAGCQNWKATERYPFLKPFAWLYQIFRYVRYGMRAKNPTQFLKTAIKESKTKTDFLAELGVSQTVK